MSVDTAAKSQVTTSLSLDSVLRGASRVRGLSELVIDLFRANEQSVKQAGLNWISTRSDIVNESDLDVWMRRSSGVLVVGSNKPLLARLIGGEDIKNQAAGTIRTATGNLIYLNLAQLMKLRLRSLHVDWQKSAIAELRDFGNCLEEALCEKLAATLLERSQVMYTTNEKGVERESFTNVERKFLGKRLLIHLGVLAHPENSTRAFQFDLDNSIWFIFCGTKTPETPQDCRGIFFRYPSLEVTFSRPPEAPSILCFAENKDSNRGSTGATWHVLEAKPSTGIDELVRAGLSFKSVTSAAPKGTARTRITQTDLPPKPRPIRPTKETVAPQSLESPQSTEAGSPTPTEDPVTPHDPTSGPVAKTEESVTVATPTKIQKAERDKLTTEVEKQERTELSDAEKLKVEEHEKKLEEELEEEEAAEEEAAEEEAAEEEAAEEGAAEEEAAPEEEAEEGDWWAQGPVEYDEAVPSYYDYQQETYFYYGNILFYDPDWSSYYYYDWEQETYMYVDEETQQAINDGTIPIWNSEDQQYYDPSQLVTEETEEAGEATPEGEVTPEGAASPEGEVTPEKGTEKAILKASEELAKQAPEEVATTSETPDISMKTETPPSVVETLDVAQETETAPPVAVESEKAAIPAEEDEASLTAEMPVQQPSLTRTAKAAVSQPPKGPDRFSGSLDTFQSSEAMLVNRAMRQLVELLEDQRHLLSEYARRPNGTLRVGRNRRLIDSLIHGTMELKSLTATDCSDVASSLAVLNLPQLIHIRQQAQNSAWDKSPQSALKTFAMKTDSLIAEKLVDFCLQRGAEATQHEETETKTEAETETARNEQLLKLLSAPERRHVGSQLIFVVGAIAELKQSREHILGEAFCRGLTPTPRKSWWFLACSPTGGVVAPRGRVLDKPKGVFLRFPNYEAQFDRPDNVSHVFKLVAGRPTGGFLQWDVLEITL